MDSDDKVLQDYVKRLMDQQYGMNSPEPLTDAELKEIALEMGMSDKEYEASLQKAEMHYHRGEKFVRANNYEDAIIELTHTVQIYPNHADGLAMLAKAYTHHGLLNDKPEDFEKADMYVDRCLQLEPMHAGALKLKSQKRKGLKGQKGAKDAKERMKRMIKYGLAAVAIAGVVITWISVSNTMAALEQRVNAEWADVENQYQRRAELIPQLVTVVKGASDFEKETLNEVINARSKATGMNIDISNVSQAELDKYLAAQNEVSGSLSKLLAIAEDYPVLRSMENYLSLQDQIEGCENRIAVTRQEWNTAVMEYNTKANTFPTSIFGYDDKAYFKADPAAHEVPEIDL